MSFGLFQILSRVGILAYRLQVPENSLIIHPMFHISQLKQAVPTTHLVATPLHQLDSLQFPVKLLQRRLITSRDSVIPQVLIQWSGWPTWLATWEDAEALQQRFP